MDLVDEAVDLQRGGFGRPSFLDWIYSTHEPSTSLSTEKLNQVLEREKRSRKFPASKRAPEFDPFGEDVDEEEDIAFEEAELEEFGRILDDLGRAKEKKKQPKQTHPDSSNQGELF
jgi:hypothetical protein